MERNVVGWFEIPVNDMERAAEFYEKVFGFKIELVDMGDLKMGWFPYDDLPGCTPVHWSSIRNINLRRKER